MKCVALFLVVAFVVAVESSPAVHRVTGQYVTRVHRTGGGGGGGQHVHRTGGGGGGGQPHVHRTKGSLNTHVHRTGGRPPNLPDGAAKVSGSGNGGPPGGAGLGGGVGLGGGADLGGGDRPLGPGPGAANAAGYYSGYIPPPVDSRRHLPPKPKTRCQKGLVDGTAIKIDTALKKITGKIGGALGSGNLFGNILGGAETAANRIVNGAQLAVSDFFCGFNTVFNVIGTELGKGKLVPAVLGGANADKFFGNIASNIVGAIGSGIDDAVKGRHNHPYA